MLGDTVKNSRQPAGWERFWLLTLQVKNRSKADRGVRERWMNGVWGKKDGMRQEMKGFLRFHSLWPHQCDHGFYELSLSTPTHHLTRARTYTHTHTHKVKVTPVSGPLFYSLAQRNTQNMCFCLCLFTFSSSSCQPFTYFISGWYPQEADTKGKRRKTYYWLSFFCCCFFPIIRCLTLFRKVSVFSLSSTKNVFFFLFFYLFIL